MKPSSFLKVGLKSSTSFTNILLIISIDSCLLKINVNKFYYDKEFFMSFTCTIYT